VELTPGSAVVQTTTLATENRSGNVTWPLWVFYAVAGTLTLLSIFLPLTAGHIYRWIVRFSRQEENMFRIVLSALWFS
jgi:hypothetical protein